MWQCVMVPVRTQPAAGIYLPDMASQLWTFMFFHVWFIVCFGLNRSVYGISVADHLEYYGVTLHADSRGTCQFVMGAANSVYSYVREVDGAIILSRYPQDPYALESVNLYATKYTPVQYFIFILCTAHEILLGTPRALLRIRRGSPFKCAPFRSSENCTCKLHNIVRTLQLMHIKKMFDATLVRFFTYCDTTEISQDFLSACHLTFAGYLCRSKNVAPCTPWLMLLSYNRLNILRTVILPEIFLGFFFSQHCRMLKTENCACNLHNMVCTIWLTYIKIYYRFMWWIWWFPLFENI